MYCLVAGIPLCTHKFPQYGILLDLQHFHVGFCRITPGWYAVTPYRTGRKTVTYNKRLLARFNFIVSSANVATIAFLFVGTSVCVGGIAGVRGHCLAGRREARCESYTFLLI